MPSLSSYVDAKYETPAYQVWAATGDAYQYRNLNGVVNIEIDRRFDQVCATAKITTAQPYSFTPDLVHRVIVREGYNGQVAVTFTGYVDKVNIGRFPNTWEIQCRDVLKLAVETWLDDVGVQYVNAQAEDAVADLLSKAGLSGGSVNLGTTHFTIGDVNPAAFKLMSVQQAIGQICSLIGWQLWASADGVVYFQYRKPNPSDTSDWNYSVPGVANILKYNHMLTDSDLRNEIVVMGYNGIRSVAQAASPYVPTPPGYRTAILSSELIDTQSMADTIAAWMLSDLNRLVESVEPMHATGNPLIDVGHTITFTDPAINVSKKFFIFGLQSRNTAGTGNNEYTVDLTLYAGTGSSPNYVPPPPEPGPPPPSPGEGDGSRLYVATDQGVARGDTMLTTPGWTAINTGLSGDGLNVFRMLFDPWSSDGTQLTGAYLACKDGIYKGAGMPNPTWTKVLDDTTLLSLIGPDQLTPPNSHFTRELVLPINIENYVGAFVKRSVDGGPSGNLAEYHYVWSTDGGATWQANTTNWWLDFINASGTGNLTGADGYIGPFLWPSHKTAGTIYMTAALVTWWDHAGVTGGPQLFRSTDSGATWAYVGSYNGPDWQPYIIIPYADATGTPYLDDSVAHATHSGFGANDGRAMEHTATFPEPFLPTLWDPEGSADILGTGTWLHDICTWNENARYMITNGGGMWSTQDGAVTWAYNDPASGGIDCMYQCLSALPSNALFCAAAGIGGYAGPTIHFVQMTLDGGTTWTDCLSNLDTVLPGITSLRSIIPDWIWVTTP